MVRFGDLLSYSLSNIAHRQLRSYLTVLGIVIGIASIVALIAIAQGLTDSINDQLSQLGSRYVAIVPGDITKMATFSADPTRPPSTGKLFLNDQRRIERVPGVDLVSSVISARADAQFKGEAASLSLTGVEPELFGQTTLLEIGQGRFLSGTDKYAVVVGYGLANKAIFKNEISAGSVIRLGAEGTPYRIVGVLKKGVNSQADGAAYVPLDDARKLAGDTLADNEVTAIRLTVKEGFDYNDTVQQIDYELMSAHGVKEDEKDYSIVTSDFVVKQVGQITGLLTLFLGGIAGISLVVGGVGIANTMFMSVIERTKEIGTLKAVGASRRDILSLFLVESAIIGLVGGIVGTALGVVVALAVKEFGGPATVNWGLGVFAIVFSLVVGIVSGYVPARRGASFSPIDALREE